MTEADTILVLNAGSSSLKFSAFTVGDDGDLQRSLHGQVAGLLSSPMVTVKRGNETALERSLGADPILHVQAAEAVLDVLRYEIGDRHYLGIGHRVVHGGAQFSAPTRIDARVLDELAACVPLAPLHQPHNLAAIRLLQERLPDVPAIACFDTAFHRSVPEVAQLYALPTRFAQAGIRRYGFHGLSYEYIAQQLPAIDARAARGRTVVLHLGNGCSMCAMADGRSVATTMGFTALEGLPMGTRSGSIDPGVLLFLMQQMQFDAATIERLLYHESGLLGLSGISSDMRELLASDVPAARTAVDVFVYRAGRELGSLVAALGGMDALVFTAGIGENQAEIRRRICAQAQWLGVGLDEEANRTHQTRISTNSSSARVLVVPTNEEVMIARHVLQALR